ncbi:hypothetical protein Esti_001353 [Eimeria stiedai]
MKQHGRGTSRMAQRPWGVILACLLVAACLSASPCMSAPPRSDQNQLSERTAAVTNQGVQGTVSGGSSRNPLINDLLSVQDLASMQKDLQQLNRLLKELGMTFYLEQSRDMTMFMPTDVAFSQLPFNIHELSWQAKWRILQFHIIPNDVVDLDNALHDKTEVSFESWEGSPLTVKRANAEGKEAQAGAQTADFIVNAEAKIVSKPPKIETFNGASYKINKVLFPPSMSEDDLKPATIEQRINPEVSQRLRRRAPRSEGTPSVEQEQQLASVDGTVQMERSSRDPRLPGSFRPDPLAQRSQATPDFVRGVNLQHARWEDSVYRRTPPTQVRDERKPQDELMGFRHEIEREDAAQSRIKVLGLKEGAVIPPDGNLPAMTRISNSGARPSGIGLAFESSEDPEAAPTDPVSHFVNVLLGGRSAPSSSNHNNKPGAAKLQQQQQQQQQKNKQGQEETSLFALQMTPTQAPPRVHALGLTEGLLPSEELITHHWSPPCASNRTPRRQQQPEHQASHSPLASLWHQINNRR